MRHRPTVYRPYLGRLESQTICRCYYKGSTFSSVIKDPECWSGWGLNLWPTTQQTGANPIELTGRWYTHSKSDRAIISTTISQSLDLPLFVCILWENIYWGMPTRQIKKTMLINLSTKYSWIYLHSLWLHGIFNFIRLFTKTELLNKTTKLKIQ